MPASNPLKLNDIVEIGTTKFRVIDVASRLLLSENIIASMRLGDASSANNWGTSEVNAWLNGAFLKSLSAVEQTSIANTSYYAKDETDGGDPTLYSTKIRLLSSTELQSYIFLNSLLSDPKRVKIGGNGRYWTRTPLAGVPTGMCGVLSDGSIVSGISVTNSNFGVCPALNLNAAVAMSSGKGTLASPYRITKMIYKGVSVIFGTNGGNALSTASTTVTINDNGITGLDGASFHYAWDFQNVTQPIAGWRKFANGDTVKLDNIRGTHYLWIKAANNNGEWVYLPSNAFVSVNGTVTVTPDDTKKTITVTDSQPDVEGIVVPYSAIKEAVTKKYDLKVETAKAYIVFPSEMLKNDVATLLSTGKSLLVSASTAPQTEITQMIKTNLTDIVKVWDLFKLNLNILDINKKTIKNLDEFSKYLNVNLKNITGYKDINRTSVANVVPSYDSSGNLIDIELYHAGGFMDNNLIDFYTNHFSFYVVMERAPVFSDISSSWARYAIETLAARNIVKGYKNVATGRFEYRPDGLVARADYSVTLNKCLGKKPEIYRGVYSDVASDKYFAGDVLSLNKYGVPDIVNDDENNPVKFNVYKNGSIISGILNVITRENAAAFITNSYNLVASYDKSLDPITTKPYNFSDLDKCSSEKMKESINVASKLGILNGFTDGSFKPKESLTREQSAQMEFNLLVKLKIIPGFPFIDVT